MRRGRGTARVSVRLFGRIEAETTDGTLRLPGRQTQALFALLCLDPRPRSRESIATDLWPEASRASTASLRQALWLIRTGLVAIAVDPEDVLDIDMDTIGIWPEAIDVDVDRFAHHARATSLDPEAAVAVYRGDLVECLGHDVFAADRERLADRFEDMLALVARTRLAAGDVERAREAAESLLARDPLREEAHEVLIAVHGATGTRSQVVRQYRHLAETLRRELDVEPLPETQVVYRAALEQTVGRSRDVARLSGFEAGPPSVTVLTAPGLASTG